MEMIFIFTMSMKNKKGDETMKRLSAFRRYVILDTFMYGLRLVCYSDYKNNSLLKAHPVIAIGTIRQLKKAGHIA